jgi:hypothetical protein
LLFLGCWGCFWDAGYAVKALAGMELRCDGGNADVEFLKGVEALSPLSSYPLTVLGDLVGPGFECFDWVVQNAIGFYWLVGVSCEGFEGSFAMLRAIKAKEYHRKQGLASTPQKIGIKVVGSWEDLECSINYDSKGECSSHGKGRKEGYQFLLWSLKCCLGMWEDW